MLWSALGVILAVLLVANFVRFHSFDAFVTLDSSSLNFDFDRGPRVETKIAEFDADTPVLAADGAALKLVGASLAEISTDSDAVSARFTSIDERQVELCLGKGGYFVSVIRAGQREESYLLNDRPGEMCLALGLSRRFIVFPRAVSVKPRVDSRGVRVYPRLSGELSIANTDKVLPLISGLSASIALERADGDREGATAVATQIVFTDGRFAMHAWKRVTVETVEGDQRRRVYYTPLNVLRKFMEENGLWYAVMLFTGGLFTLRKVLLLR